MSIIPKENDRGSITVAERDGYYIEILPMIYNWRLVLTPVDMPMVYDAGWCYFGTGPETYTRVYTAADKFWPSRHAEPEGYDKALQDRRLP